VADFKEKRRYKRVKGVFNTVLLPDPTRDIEFTCKSIDISEGGIGVVTVREAIPKTLILVKFTLPGYKEVLILTSEVVWIHPSKKGKGWFDAGIRFVTLNGQERNTLKKYIAKHSGKE